MYIQELTDFGLSEKEAKIYLALLELEVATVQEVAKIADVNRSSAYVVLEALKRRGLVSVSPDKRIQKYVVAPPESLLRIAEQDAKDKLNIRHRINAILPDLKSLYKGTRRKPKIQIYSGREGLITAFEETLKCREKLVRVASSVPRLQGVLPDYLPGYVKKRIELGIRMHGIHPFEPMAEWLRANLAKNFDTAHLIPPDKWQFESDFIIFDNSIHYVLPAELMAISIEDSAVADAMKKIFDLAFEEAGHLDVSNVKSVAASRRGSRNKRS